MKKMKKITSLVLALLMMLAVSATAFAATGSSTITITGVPSENHTFSAYQIFDGDYDANTGRLSNVVWGDAIADGDAALTAVTALSGFGSCTSAADVAEVLAATTTTQAMVDAFAATIKDYIDTTATSGSFSSAASGTTYTYTNSTVDVGYYLVLDTTTSQTGDSVSAYILYVADGTGTIAFKNGVPTVEKYILEGTDEVKGTSASANETVTFELVGTVPSATALAKYTSYTYEFEDTLSTNLTYADNLVVSASTAGTLSSGTGTGTYSFEQNGQNLTITINDALALAGQTITVTYNATLDSNAVAGTAETNSVYIEYSNNPNDTTTSNTVTKTVNVYTFDVIVNKTDGTDPLDGAGFTLYKSIDNGTTWTAVETISTGTTFTFNDLGEGLYKLEETTVPAGYNKAEDIIFTIEATYDPTTGTITNLSETSGEFTVTMADGELEATVINRSGSTMPTTGGMGTTIFYIVGAVLVVGAGVLLVVRRRMNSSK